MEDNLQNQILVLEKELHDLKTIQGAVRSARAYSYAGTFGESGARIILQITYADGDTPIILSWEGSDLITPLRISGNKQKIFLAIYGGQVLNFYSTREIKSIARL